MVVAQVTLDRCPPLGSAHRARAEQRPEPIRTVFQPPSRERLWSRWLANSPSGQASHRVVGLSVSDLRNLAARAPYRPARDLAHRRASRITEWPIATPRKLLGAELSSRPWTPRGAATESKAWDKQGARMPGLLDVILGYDCNLACDYCTITPAMRTRSLAPAAVVAAMRTGRSHGYDRIAFTGGEPTIRPDLVALIKAARKLGFEDIKVQSNGLLFTQVNVARLVDAGVTRFHVSIHTHEARAYDALVQRAGAYASMEQGLRNVVASGRDVVVDVIIKSDTYRRLPDAIEWIAARGVRAVHFWYVSLTDGNAERVESLPAMTQAMPYVRRALEIGRERELELSSLHLPRCLLGDDWTHAWDPGSMRVLVVTPDATFELEDSRLAGRNHVPACAGCRFETICPGVRDDYLQRFGDVEIAAARGQQATIAGAVHLPVIE
jgi:MoaA/NifB/PqqE/SkfB family radical SAM enzyme